MEKAPGAARGLAAVGTLLLAATACFHATGYPGVAAAVTDPAIDPFYSRALPGVWIFFSWHLFALALGAGWAAASGKVAARPLLLFISLVAIVDTLFVAAGAGPLFAGTLILATAALALAISVTRWRAGP